MEELQDIFYRIKCKHNDLEFYKNIYGDNINGYSSGVPIYRSIWRCKNCGKLILRENLYYGNKQ